MLSDFHFIRPYWLAALLPLAVILVLYWRRRVGAAIWGKLVDAHLLPHLLTGEEGGPRRLPLILAALGWVLLVAALAGPVWEKLPQPVFGTTAQRAILLDLSPSMNAADVAPSRLARARFEMMDLLRASKEGQVALLAFGPEPFVVAPLSGDANTIAAQVPQLSTDLIPAPGPRRTDLALKLAGDMLDRAQARNADVILVTDGVGGMAGSLQAAQTLAADGHRVSVLAVGTAKGAPVPGGKGGFLQNDDGSIQVARLDASALRELAKAGGGRYLEASVGDRDTAALTARGPRLDQEIQETTLTADQWREEGPWLLLLVLPLAALAFRRGWLLALFAVFLVLPPTPSQAFGWSDLWLTQDQQAARQLESGQAQEAAQGFRDPGWRAAASYRAGDFNEALEQVSGLDGADANYNRGNALARLGRLEDAVTAYQQALEQAPEHADAQHNLELVQQLLEQKEQDDKQQSGEDGKEGDQKQSEQKQSQDHNSEQGEHDQQDKQDQQASGEQGEGQGSEGEQSQQGDTGNAREDAGADHTKPSGQDGSQDGSQTEADAKSAASQSAEGRQSSEDAAEGKQPDTAPNAPGADDFSQEALNGASRPEGEQDGDNDAGADLKGLSGQEGEESKDKPESAVAGMESLSPEEREQQQAIEAQLRRVPDDPAGLIRQRFLLQHLRREGRLP
ncbi:VWA domain-containing protein [Thiocystis violacea]|uniref:VWA domain-containing protein n=1 Tax=Thiocystis violacea TaxID=13725 RepID=UPI0019045A86|nr:VWA domain-containing protein [Thiocystis violacea]MBK1722006.1 hypothetical protein [Thiocystis violacea]